MSREVDNNQDVLDSRDIIARLEELESTLQDAIADQQDNEESEEGDIDSFTEEQIASSGEFSEEASEYKSLKALCDEAEGYAEDWQYGSTLIRESYVTEYSRELCDELGYLPTDLPDFISSNIDWDGVAKDLLIDYTEVDFDGVTYYVR